MRKEFQDKIKKLEERINELEDFRVSQQFESA